MADVETLLAEASQILRTVDPSACLVLPRVVRRVIKSDNQFAGFAVLVPHRKSYILSRERLLWYTSADELGPEPPRTEQVVLLAHPDEQELEGMRLTQLLREVWRSLFHARVHVELNSEVAVGRLTPAVVHARIDEIGQSIFDEIHSVLQIENYLLYPGNRVELYIEFASVYLELRHFAPDWLYSYFPAIHDFDHVDSILAQDIDSLALFQKTCLPGAALPGEPAAELLEPTVRQLLERANEASQRGNAVNAALLRAHAEAVVPPAYVSESQRSAGLELDRLSHRLQQALDFPADEIAQWRRALGALLANSRRGFWRPDKRILYDLQNICVDHERDVHVLNPLGWLLTLGRTPLKRSLPHLRDVLVARHLRRAQARLPAAQLDAVDREALTRLVRQSALAADLRLRSQFRPVIAEALQSVGLQAQNLPERVAVSKVVEELLDSVVERGYLNLGILRDAVSRNNLKLNDFPDDATAQAARERRLAVPQSLNGQYLEVTAAPPVEATPARFSVGAAVWRCLVVVGRICMAMVGSPKSADPLLKANAQLSKSLDGVYRRAEIYLRALQGFSAVMFGTPVGRFLTQYLILPIGGSYVILMGLKHLEHLARDLLLHQEAHEIAAADGVEIHASQAAAAHAHHGPVMPEPVTWVVTSLLIFGLLHIPPFRRLVVQYGLQSFYKIFRGVFYDFPIWALRIPVVRRILFSGPVVFLWRFVMLPTAVTAAVWLAVWIFKAELSVWWWTAIFSVINIVLNSRIGRDMEELSAEWVGKLWYRIRVQILVALYELVMDTFKSLLENAERVMYAVDEWLRFRSGESRLAFVSKAILGVVWAGVTYVLRFCINLLIEPQINPIKHFPVVTVSHKIILPTQPYWAALFVVTMGSAWANFLAVGIVTAIPGIFGFLVWELKENWRLYAANRPKYLSPVMIGHHGETLGRLMKPGLHSGTVPRLFNRIRRGHRKNYLLRWRVAIKRYHEELHHLEQALKHFFEREFIALLHECPSWNHPTVNVGELHVASNSLRVEIVCPDAGRESLWLCFEEQSGWLVSSVSEPGWLRTLPKDQRDHLALALLGLYKLGGVDLIREHLAAAFAPQRFPYDIREQTLVLWPTGDFTQEIHYNLDDRPSRPRPRLLARNLALPELDPQRILYNFQKIQWTDWVQAWESKSPEVEGQVVRHPVHLLPPEERIEPRDSIPVNLPATDSLAAGS